MWDLLLMSMMIVFRYGNMFVFLLLFWKCRVKLDNVRVCLGVLLELLVKVRCWVWMMFWLWDIVLGR